MARLVIVVDIPDEVLERTRMQSPLSIANLICAPRPVLVGKWLEDLPKLTGKPTWNTWLLEVS